MEELYEYLSSKTPIPEKSIVITFDDGYEDNYLNAYPILKRYGFKGTVFVVGNYIDHSGYLSTQQIKEMISSGWNIEGHTSNHVDLATVDDQTLAKELRESKEKLESIGGKPIHYFAYPFGVYNGKIVGAAKDAGYKMAFTTERGWAKLDQDIMLLSRVYCYAQMGLDEFTRRITNPAY